MDYIKQRPAMSVSHHLLTLHAWELIALICSTLTFRWSVTDIFAEKQENEDFLHFNDQGEISKVENYHAILDFFF